MPDIGRMLVVCPKCQSTFGVARDQIGRQAKCGQCVHVFAIPEGEALEPAFGHEPPPVPSVDQIVDEVMAEDDGQQLQLPMKRPEPFQPRADEFQSNPQGVRPLRPTSNHTDMVMPEVVRAPIISWTFTATSWPQLTWMAVGGIALVGLLFIFPIGAPMVVFTVAGAVVVPRVYRENVKLITVGVVVVGNLIILMVFALIHSPSGLPELIMLVLFVVLPAALILISLKKKSRPLWKNIGIFSAIVLGYALFTILWSVIKAVALIISM